MNELTGHPIAHDQVVEGIRTEMVQLETLEVGDTYPWSPSSRTGSGVFPAAQGGRDAFGQQPSQEPS